MASTILKKARPPLHVSEILDRIKTQFGVSVDRESLVSSSTKKVARGDRFLRPEKNTSRSAGGAMSLLAAFLAITPIGFRFPQQRTYLRAVRQASVL